MRHRGHTIMLFGAWLAACGEAYEPPCKVVERQPILSGVAVFQLRPLDADRILVIDAPPLSPDVLLHQYASGQSSAEIVLLSAAGATLGRWSLTIPVGSA